MRKHLGGGTRWVVLALMAGLAIGAVTITPALGGGLFTKHKAKNLFYTKAASDARFLTPGAGDARYLTPGAGDARYLTPGAGDARYLTPGAGDARYLTPGAGDARYLPGAGNVQIQIGTDSFEAASVGAFIIGFTGGTNLRGIGQNTLSFNAPITVPSVLQGRPTQIDSVVLCYAASATATLDNVTLDKTTSVTAPGIDTALVTDDTDRTDAACRTYTPAAPAAIGPNDMIQLVVTGRFSTTADLAVSRLTVNLSD
jgi:hypothetical protein